MSLNSVFNGVGMATRMQGRHAPRRECVALPSSSLRRAGSVLYVGRWWGDEIGDLGRRFFKGNCSQDGSLADVEPYVLKRLQYIADHLSKM